jgi:hypothetical protein
MMSWATFLITTVLLISRKFWRWAQASSCAFPLNGVACTMLMRLGLSSNSRLLVLSVGPVRMFSVLGAENSRRVLSAIASETSVEFPLNLVVLIDESCWITTNPALILYKIWTKTYKAKPAKAKVMVVLISIYFSILLCHIALSQQRHQKCLLAFLSITLTKLSSLALCQKCFVDKLWMPLINSEKIILKLSIRKRTNKLPL